MHALYVGAFLHFNAKYRYIYHSDIYAIQVDLGLSLHMKAGQFYIS